MSELFTKTENKSREGILDSFRDQTVGSTRLTKHASSRSQKRCIPPLIREWLITYGRRIHDRRGGIKCYFDRKAKKNLGREVGYPVVEHLGSLLDTYLVLSEDNERIITVGHRKRHIKR